MSYAHKPQLHAAHRANFLSSLGKDAALFFGAAHHLRNGDAEFTYRQSSDVLYLSGWEDPEVVLLFRPESDHPFVMFVQPRDPARETWTGRRKGPEGAMTEYGADMAWPIAELEHRLPSLLQGYRVLHYRFAENAEHDRLLSRCIARARRQARVNGLDVPDTFVDPSRNLHALRLIKSQEEIDILRIASKITGEAHKAAMSQTAPGVYEYELEAIINGTFRRRGGSGPGYTTIVGGGDNATILHYIKNKSPLNSNELVCVDAGCEYGWYTADVTRTWPVNGTFNPHQRALYEVVLLALTEATRVATVGNTFEHIHDVATKVLTEGMVELGLLKGDVDILIETGAHKKYYMHRTSHWLGLDVHDVGRYVEAGASVNLLPGMVLTIEPGLYISADDESVPEHYRGI